VVTPGTAGTVTLGPGSDGAGNPDINFKSGIISSQATYNAMFPTGTYTFNLTDSADMTLNTTVMFTDNHTGTFPPIPALTPASFTALQGMDPTQALTVMFNQFDSNPNAPGELGFFFILDNTSHVTVFFDAPPPNVTSENIPANTLQAGKQYLFALFFTTSGGPPNTNELLEMNSETKGLFTTAGAAGAVPEPGTAGLVLLGAVAILGLKRKRCA